MIPIPEKWGNKKTAAAMSLIVKIAYIMDFNTAVFHASLMLQQHGGTAKSAK